VSATRRRRRCAGNLGGDLDHVFDQTFNQNRGHHTVIWAIWVLGGVCPAAYGHDIDLRKGRRRLPPAVAGSEASSEFRRGAT